MVDNRFTWNLNTLIDVSAESMIEDIKRYIEDILEYKDNITEDNVADALALCETACAKMERVNGYAMLSHLTDLDNVEFINLYKKTLKLSSELLMSTSYVDEGIRAIGIDALMNSSNRRVSLYHRYFEQLKLEDDTLDSNDKKKLIRLRNSVNATYEKFIGLINSNNGFRLTEEDNLYSLPKEERFSEHLKKIKKSSSELFDLYKANIEKSQEIAILKGYSSYVEMCLKEDNVNPKVYYNLLSALKKNSDIPRTFLEKINSSPVHLYELFNTTAYDDFEGDYDDCCRIVYEAVKSFGEDYADTLLDGLTRGRWVDVYPHEGKREGGCSACIYNSNPFILLDFKDDSLRSLLDLGHECGHAMHFKLAHDNNPYHCWAPTSFEGEIVSTVNEQIILDYLSSSKRFRYLDPKKAKLAKLENIMDAIYPLILKSELDSWCHQNIDILTLDTLKAEYDRLLREYYGEHVIVDENAYLKFLCDGNILKSFYVYKYALGMLITLSILNRGDFGAYLDFLKRGGSLSPMENVKSLGIDTMDEHCFDEAISMIRTMVDSI